jgi:hypothetical protein
MRLPCKPGRLPGYRIKCGAILKKNDIYPGSKILCFEIRVLPRVACGRLEL